MEGAEAANTKMHLAILAPQGSSTVLKTRCPTMQLALGFWFPFGCWPVFQVSTQAHRQGTAKKNESVNRGAGVALTSSAAFILGLIRGGSFAQRLWLELLAIECDGDGDFLLRFASLLSLSTK